MVPSSHVWREVGQVPGEDWFYHVVIAPCAGVPGSSNAAGGLNTGAGLPSATTFKVHVDVVCYNTGEGGSASFDLDALKDHVETNQGTSHEVDELKQMLRVGLSGKRLPAGAGSAEDKYIPARSPCVTLEVEADVPTALVVKVSHDREHVNSTTLRLPPHDGLIKGVDRVQDKERVAGTRETVECTMSAVADNVHHTCAAAMLRALASSRRREQAALDALERGLRALRDDAAMYDEHTSGGARAKKSIAGLSPVKPKPSANSRQRREEAMQEMEKVLDAANARALGQAAGDEEDEGGERGEGEADHRGGADSSSDLGRAEAGRTTTKGSGTVPGAGGARLVAGKKHDRHGLLFKAEVDKSSR